MWRLFEKVSETAEEIIYYSLPFIGVWCFSDGNKNFLGHSSILTTQIYAELSQATVDRNLKEWNEKWFKKENFEELKEQANRMPIFLMP